MSAALRVHSDDRFADRALADIAATLPGATALFRCEKLDFDCGGKISLGESAVARRCDLAKLIATLEALATALEPANAPEDTYALMIRLARQVEAVHRGISSLPFGLAGMIEQITAKRECHLPKAEQALLPLMRHGDHPMNGHPIAVMLAEHDHHGGHLRALKALTEDFTPPENAFTNWRVRFAGTRKLADDPIEHVHTENNKLFRASPRDWRMVGAGDRQVALAGAGAEQSIAPRASCQGEAGDHLPGQTLSLRHYSLVVRPLADQCVAIKAFFQQPQPVRGAAKLRYGGSGGAGGGGGLLDGKAPENCRIRSLAGRIQGHGERRVRRRRLGIPAPRQGAQDVQTLWNFGGGRPHQSGQCNESGHEFTSVHAILPLSFIDAPVSLESE